MMDLSMNDPRSKYTLGMSDTSRICAMAKRGQATPSPVSASTTRVYYAEVLDPIRIL